MCDAYLNQQHVRTALRLPPLEHQEWASCSPLVDKIMGHDVMKSVKGLVEDLLDYVPVLLYQVCISGAWGMCISRIMVKAHGSRWASRGWWRTCWTTCRCCYTRCVLAERGACVLAGSWLRHMGRGGRQGAGGGPAGLRAGAAIPGVY